MSSATSPFFFPFSEQIVSFTSKFLIGRNWKFSQVDIIIFIIGLAAPLPLLFHNLLPNIYLTMLSPVLLMLYVLLDYALPVLETHYGKRSRCQAIIPIPAAMLFFIWYEIMVCEVTYARAQIAFLRYYNLAAVFCLIACALLVYGYLKIKGHSLNIREFAGLLERFKEENEKQAPLNFITLGFKVLKKDFIVVAVLVASFFNIYFLYILLTVSSIALLGFTVYILLLMEIFSRSKAAGEPQSPADN
jgi:hypothetical protein